MSVEDTQLSARAAARESIERAIALLMARHGVSRDAAIAILVKLSNDAHLSVREESVSIVRRSVEYVAPEVFLRLASSRA